MANVRVQALSSGSLKALQQARLCHHLVGVILGPYYTFLVQQLLNIWLVEQHKKLANKYLLPCIRISNYNFTKTNNYWNIHCSIHHLTQVNTLLDIIILLLVVYETWWWRPVHTVYFHKEIWSCFSWWSSIKLRTHTRVSLHYGIID